MDGQSLADQIIDAQKTSSQSDEGFSLDSAPDRFFRLHPSTCWVGEHIVCRHEVLTDEPKALMRLLDHPQAKLDYPAAAWLFERIKERAPVLNSRYILVSNEFVWDRDEAKLLPVFVPPKTTNDTKAKERIEEYDERRSVERVGQNDGSNTVFTGGGDSRGDSPSSETFRGSFSDS